MECATISQLPVPQLEPVHQLGPYLNGLNVTDALESFTHLADLVLSSDESGRSSPANLTTPNSPSDCYSQTPTTYYNHHQYPHPHPSPPPSSSSSSPSSLLSSSSSFSLFTSSASASASHHQQLVCLSPDGATSYSNRCSPAPSDSSYLGRGSYYHLRSPSSNWSSSCISSSASSFSSSSGPASVASSTDGFFAPSPGSTTAAGSSRSARRRGPKEPSNRRQKNANAAERYRKKIKGHRFTLAEEVEREEERNASLRRDVESKLTLYREFVSLLARNTHQNDRELASLGSRSLSNILGNICTPNLFNGQERVELMEYLKGFQNILVQSASNSDLGEVNHQQNNNGDEYNNYNQEQQPQQQQRVASDNIMDVNEQQALELESGLVYDFFADRFLPAL